MPDLTAHRDRKAISYASFELPEAIGERSLKVWNCTGECVVDETRELGAGLHSVAIPPAGTATFET